jgi:fatty acid desaturase
MNKPSGMSEEEIYRVARRNVERKRGAQTHLFVFIIVNMFLSLIWALPFGGQGFLQLHIVLAGIWAVGVIVHFLIAYLSDGDDKWDREAIEKEAERLRSRIDNQGAS